MKKSISFLTVAVFFLLLCSQNSYAQFLDKVKNAKDKVKNTNNDISNKTGIDLGAKARGTAMKSLDKSRAKYDSTNFSYAVAVSDNTGFYEEKDRLRDIGADKVAMSFIQSGGRVNVGTAVNTTVDAATDDLLLANTKNNFGEMAFASNKFVKAENNFLDAKALYEKNKQTNTIYYAKNISNLGLIYSATGRFELSEEYTNKALELKEAILGKNSLDYASSLNNKAVLLNQIGRYNEAEQAINQAISINEGIKSTDQMPLAILYNNKAFIWQTTGRFQQAEQAYEKALQIAGDETSKKKLNYLRILINKGLLLQEMKRTEEALKIYEKSVEIMKKKGSKTPDYAHLLNLTASAYMETEKYDKVEKYLNDALAIYKSKFGETHPAYANTLDNLGSFYCYKGNFPKAEESLKKALEIRKNTLGETHPDYNATKENLATTYWQAGKIPEATVLFKEVLTATSEFVKIYFPPMSESEKEKYWAKLRPTYLKFFNFAYQNYTKDPSLLADIYNYHITTKGILLSATNKIKQRIMASKNQALINDYSVWIAKKELLARLYTLSKEELTEEEIDIKAIENEANTLEKKLSSQSADFKQGFDEKQVTFKEIDASLAADEAALEVISFPKYLKKFTNETIYVALVAGKFANGQPQIALISESKDIENDDFKYYKNAIRTKKENKYGYKAYWEKVEPLLVGKKKIYTSLDGVYNQININTLLKPNGKFVVDEINLLLLTNTKFVPETKIKEKKGRQTHSKSAVLIGFPTYGTRNIISALPGTKKEVDAIKPLLVGYKVQTLLAENATETNFKKIDDAAQPGIIHIATHGFFLDDVQETNDKVFGIEPTKAKENPLLRAGILLANSENTLEGIKDEKDRNSQENGVLNGLEIMNMNLEPTELVIISACETGLGDVKAGEGVYGLQRAFQVAGADALIMSLWKVSDDATQELMTLFYKNWVATGNKSTAFRQAQISLKQKYKDPYFWGAFVMVGY